MQRYYLLTAGVVACLSSAITWYLVDPQSFVPYTNKHLQRRLVSSSSRSSSSNASNTNFTYKFSLQWPPSWCSFKRCEKPIPHVFTIHGLWVQDANDERIPAYRDNRSCTSLKPKCVWEMIDALQPIEEDLKQYWPNLKNYTSQKDNRDFWEHEWKKHGMCSDYAENPIDYFNYSLQLRKSFHPAFQLIPGETYTVQKVADTIRGQVGAKPEIACSRSRKGNKPLLLWEVRLCYDKEGYPKPEAAINCTKNFSGACTSLDNRINFPNRTLPASGTDEMPNHLAGIGSDFQAGTDEM